MKYEDISTKEMQCFLALAQELNFARAAQKIGMSQPSFSRLIMKLENKVGAQLLERTTRQVLMTRAGEYFEMQAKAVLDTLANAIEETRRMAGGTIGQLRIGYNAFAISGRLPEIIRRFREKCPDVELALTRGGTLPLISSLEKSQLDVVFVLPNSVDPKIRGRLAWSESLVVVMLKDDPLAAHERISPKVLDNVPMVMGGGNTWLALSRSINAIMKSKNANLHVTAEAEDTSSIMGLVEAGIGRTIHTAGIANQLSHQLVTRPLDVEQSPENISQTMMYWHSSLDGDEVVEQFLMSVEAVTGSEEQSAGLQL